MNDYAKMILGRDSRRYGRLDMRGGMRDGRNPYGSRGGYVTSDRAYEEDMRRDRIYGMYDDMARGRRRDHKSGDMKRFTDEEVEEWKRSFQNADGTKGEHFLKEQVQQSARKAGVDVEEFGHHIFCLAMNMIYSDYCKVAQKYGVDRPEFFADMAKAFLRDKDFDGTPEEKLYIYFKAIAEKEDE